MLVRHISARYPSSPRTIRAMAPCMRGHKGQRHTILGTLIKTPTIIKTPTLIKALILDLTLRPALTLTLALTLALTLT